MKGGQEVAVKVQRAGLKALFDQDLQVNDSSKNSEDVEHDTHGACVSAKTYKSIGLEGKLSANTLPLLLEHHTVRSNGHIHRR